MERDSKVQAPLWLVPNVSEDTLVEKLTEREFMVLCLIAECLSNQQMAQRLVVTVSTIKTHLNNIYAKLHVHTRLQAVIKSYELGILHKHMPDTPPHSHYLKRL